MGFVHAQLELTFINLMIPFLYVSSLLFFRSLSLVETKTLLAGVPVAAVAAFFIYDRSGFKQPYIVMLIFTFILGRILSVFCNYSKRNPLMMKNPFLRINQTTQAVSVESHFAKEMAQNCVYLLLRCLLLVGTSY